MIGRDRFRAAVTSSRRQRRCGSAEQGQTRWPLRACGELLTCSARPCPALIAAMGKGSSRGHHPPLGTRSHPETWGLPGSPWQRSPARIPAPRPPWGLAAGTGGLAGTRASRDKDGFPVSRVAGGRLGRGAVWCQVPARAPRGLRAGLGAERAGPPLGTAGECWRPAPPAAAATQAAVLGCSLQVVMNTLKKRILPIMKRQVVRREGG